jgi:tRNA(fMet)-specific endonuclease VapC
MDNDRLCIDTSALIAYLKGREPGAAAVEKAVKERTCSVTAITVYELLFGVARARRQIGEEALIGVMNVVPFDELAARRAARLHDDLIRNNKDIGVKDVLIAAICLEHSLPLLTLNEQHFARVVGLTVFDPNQFLVHRES